MGGGEWTNMMILTGDGMTRIMISKFTNVHTFKNTTFLLIIGIFEILSTTQAALTNSNWLGGHSTEGYAFVALLFWICCFSMSMISNSIERKLETSHRN